MRVKRRDYKLLKELVYTLVSMIPVGRVVSYKDLSIITGISPRIVGRILKENENPIIIPCHRVVRADGDVGGYSGSGGRGFKKKLLELEGVKFKDWKVEKSYFWDGLNKMVECA